MTHQRDRRLDRLERRVGTGSPFPWLDDLSNAELAELEAALTEQRADEPAGQGPQG